MKNIDDLVEQIHTANAEQRRLECRPRPAASPRRAAAVVLAVAATAAAAWLLIDTKAEQPALVAQYSTRPAAAPHTTPPAQHADDAPKPAPGKAAAKAAKEEAYAYSEIGEGIRVYCENQCDPQAALDQVELVLASL